MRNWQAELDKEKKRIDDAKRRHAALGVDLRTAEASLARLQNQPSAETQRKNLADKMKTLSLKRVKISRSLDSVSSAFIKCHTLETQPVFSQLQAVASLMALETTLASRTDEQATVIREYEESELLHLALTAAVCADADVHPQCRNE